MQRFPREGGRPSLPKCQSKFPRQGKEVGQDEVRRRSRKRGWRRSSRTSWDFVFRSMFVAPMTSREAEHPEVKSPSAGMCETKKCRHANRGRERKKKKIKILISRFISSCLLSPYEESRRRNGDRARMEEGTCEEQSAGRSQRVCCGDGVRCGVRQGHSLTRFCRLGGRKERGVGVMMRREAVKKVLED